MNKHKYTFNLFERYAKMIKKARILGGVCMKTEWLEWLVLFKKYKSLQKVSDVCHVTPQNIGKMFNHLEDELGVQLFEKKGKTIYLTVAGQELADTSEVIISSLEIFKDKYTAQQKTISGSLEVLSTTSQIMQDVLNSFLRRYPDVKVSYVDTTFEEALKYVKTNPDAIAFIPIWQNATFYKMLKKYEPYCNIQMLYKDEQRVFAAKDSLLGTMKSNSLNDLKEKKIVSYSKSEKPDEAKHIFKNIIQDNIEFDLNITGTNSMYYFQTMVKNGLAVGMGLYSNFKYLEEDKAICSMKIYDELVSPCVWSLVYNVNKKITECDKAFFTMLTQHCTQLKKS